MKAADRLILSDQDRALNAVQNLSSYELHNFCADIPVRSFCDAEVLIALIQRIGEKDHDPDEYLWDELIVDNAAKMNPHLRKDLLHIFTRATKLFPSIKSFAEFMQMRIDVFGYQTVGSKKAAERSLRAYDAACRISETGHFSPDDICTIYSLACLCPADLMYSLIGTCLKHEAAIPAIVRLITNELRSCATRRAHVFDHNLLVTTLVQHVYFNRHADVPLKISHLVRSFLKESAEDPVLRMTDVVHKLIVVYDHVHDMAHLTRALIHLIESETGHSSSGEEWDQIELVHLLKFFTDCLLDLCDDPVTKEQLLHTIDLILRHHYKRHIEQDEIEDVALMYSHKINRLPLLYFQPYTKCDLMQTLDLISCSDPTEVLLIVAFLDRELQNVFNYSGYPAKDLTGFLPFMTRTEWSRVYNFLIHFYEPNDVMCNILNLCIDHLSQPDCKNTRYIVTALNDVFRCEYGCGTNQTKRTRAIVIPDRRPLADRNRRSRNRNRRRGVRLDEDGCRRPLFRAPHYRRDNWKYTYYNEIEVIRQPYSEFKVLHLLLMLDCRLIPDPNHKVVRDMAESFMVIRSEADWDGTAQQPSPARPYTKNTNMWWALRSEQQQLLIQIDPELSVCYNSMYKHVPKPLPI
jgi:hypothetical protein